VERCPQTGSTALSSARHASQIAFPLCGPESSLVEARGEEREESRRPTSPLDEPCKPTIPVMGSARRSPSTPRSIDCGYARHGVAEKSFKVSLGTGGVGKHTAGDSRTPLGTYPLGKPIARPSTASRFQWAIPRASRSSAATPARTSPFTDPCASTAKPTGRRRELDWTRGCIALGTDAAIAIVADWVKEHRPCVVHIY
jgi:hypothetical protein